MKQQDTAWIIQHLARDYRRAVTLKKRAVEKYGPYSATVFGYEGELRGLHAALHCLTLKMDVVPLELAA